MYVWMYRWMDRWMFLSIGKQIISVCRLENNHFKDNVMELLGSLLSAKDCQVQKIRSGSGWNFGSNRQTF